MGFLVKWARRTSWRRFPIWKNMDTKRLILIAEDDDQDVELLRLALAKEGVTNPIRVVNNGREAIDYLRATGKYEDRQVYPFPGVLFLDLNLPLVPGFEVLQWIKDNEECRIIPVMVLTSSALERDITRAYQLGASCFMTKPGSFDELRKMVSLSFRFWSMCEIPPLPVKC
jgi:CheY-like chemotaxis protein